MKLIILSAFVVLAAVLFHGKEHNEEALVADFSHPPPWPIFIAVNIFAATLRKIADALTPPPIKMMDLADDYQTTMLCYAAVKFRIPDFLSTGPKSVDEIAGFMNTKETLRVERLMYALASESITQLDKTSPDPNKPRFVNTGLSATLRTDIKYSMASMVGHQVEEAMPVWMHLVELFGPDAKANSWDTVFPEFAVSEGGFWKYLQANPKQEKQFGLAMTSLEGLGGKAMALDGPFERFNRFVDVGGSMGHFLYSVLDTYQDKKAILFDRPPVIENAKKLWLEENGTFNKASDRVEFVAGSFFEEGSLPTLEDGDAVYMRYILHDWADKEAEVILSNLRKRIGNKDVTVLIGESAMPDRHTVAQPAVIHHIDMQMMAVLGDAVERTPSMWKELLPKVGFKFVTIYPTRSLLQWVEAVPV